MSKERVGDVVVIKLKDGSYAYGRAIKNPVMAFYDLRSNEIVSINSVLGRPVAFKLWVMNSAVDSGRWQIIGNAPLEADLQTPATFFKEDAISKKLFLHSEGKQTPATRSECEGLERAAVWSAEHVEDRLLDYFEKRPNKWAESLKLRA